MTPARQERKRQNPASVRWVAVLLGAFLSAAAAYRAGPAGAATTELIVTDRHSGLAISGFDPVAYFTDGRARLGRGEFELRHDGVIWRFRNEGNRAAFAANPEVFAPRFGGYDPTAIARGASTAGNPEIWLIVQDRLYLFYSDADRDAFARNFERIVAAARQRWPEVARTLSP